jgi:hypothetical protein
VLPVDSIVTVTGISFLLRMTVPEGLLDFNRATRVISCCWRLWNPPPS